MRIINAVFIVFCIFLTGCAANPGITSLTGEQKARLNTIQVSTDGIALPHKVIGKAEGLSCSQNAFGPAAANEAEAMQAVRVNALFLKADAVINVVCKNNGVNWGSCWSSILCVGDAVRFTANDLMKPMPAKPHEDGEAPEKSARNIAGAQPPQREPERDTPAALPVAAAVPTLPVPPVVRTAPPPPPAVAVAVAVAQPRKPVASTYRITTVTGISVEKDGITISTATEPEYAHFAIDNPGRIVIDIANGKNAIGRSQINANRFGVLRVRVGSYPEKLRVVIDLAASRTPQYKVEKTVTGLRIRFSGTN